MCDFFVAISQTRLHLNHVACRRKLLHLQYDASGLSSFVRSPARKKWYQIESSRSVSCYSVMNWKHWPIDVLSLKRSAREIKASARKTVHLFRSTAFVLFDYHSMPCKTPDERLNFSIVSRISYRFVSFRIDFRYVSSPCFLPHKQLNLMYSHSKLNKYFTCHA